MTYGRYVSALNKKANRLQPPCRIMLIAVIIKIVHIRPFRPIRAQRNKGSIRNPSVFCFPVFQIFY